MYIPHFSPNEFRAPTGHYRLARARDGDILYAYIRKNSSTAFKKFINRRPHPRYLLKSLLGIEKFPKMHLKGNMRYSKVPSTGNIETIGCNTAIFVYRDPAERLVSAFMNKFIDGDGSIDIKSNYSRVMGKEPEDATFRDFIAYTALGFAEIDVHLHPQKAHLWDIPYQPIPMGHLKEALSVMLPEKTVERYFGRKHNSSDANARNTFEGALVDMPAKILQAEKAKGNTFAKCNFLTEETRASVSRLYWQDYQMIEEIGDPLALVV